MAKKKIIAFIDWYLPGYKAGGGQRAFANMVSYLCDTYDFYIITRNTDFLEVVSYEGIESEKWLILKDGENVYYCAEEKVGKDLYKQLIRDVQPDFAYINGVYSWKFSILPLIVLKQIGFNGKKVLGTYGMLAPTAISIKKRKKLLFIKLSKLTGLYKNVLFHTTSEKETNDVIKALGPEVKVQMAPHLPVKELPELNVIKKEKGNLKLISLARISPEKNTKFALEVLKKLKEDGGVIVFDLYGPVYDTDYWNECQQVIEQLPSHIKVNYKGVADGRQVLNLLNQYHALFMPTRGENFGYVILESFMAGRPVLISDQTPWRQLEKEKCGWDLDLNRSTDYKSALKELFNMEQEEFDLLCGGARKRAERFINDPELKEGNVGLFSS